ncbi:NAD(P)(+)--arginine ADP-ribosyltransferase 2-like [Ahaetulla prasina]|uniref:NAD(P)(+)--arginine ADP-ribosyltransferase 2-like n=1 Tax=Ahaetulla prasina TaxID=499056 RepID=UPI0026474F05|nr:NAD(P)(+)--arginine ADP-ribosyltransferase 2-like [Ahaetulla prasina]
MKTPIIQMALALCLIGFFTGPLQVLSLQKIPLDMAKNSVDDQYLGCNPMRELKLQQPGYLPIPQEYRATWEKAQWHWAKLSQTIGYLNPVYGTAVVAYTMASSLYSDFNWAVHKAGKSQYSYNQFAFKDFHFLLTKVVKARKIPGKCYNVFRGVKGIRFNVRFRQIVRFGQFASTSLVKDVAQKFGEDTFFSIKTCHGVPIHDLSYYPSEMEVLIPPYEKFVVIYHGKGHKGVTIQLESRGVYSHINCEVLQGH